MEDIQKYLLKIGFDVNDLPEVFNNDDKSYYTIPDLIHGYSEHKKSNAPKFEPQGKYEYDVFYTIDGEMMTGHTKGDNKAHATSNFYREYESWAIIKHFQRTKTIKVI